MNTPAIFRNARYLLPIKFSACALYAGVSLISATEHSQAVVTSGSSAATAINFNVSSTVALGVTSATSSVVTIPIPTSQGTAPGTYSTSGGPTAYSNGGASVSLSASLLSVSSRTFNVSGTALQSNATSSVDGASGSRATTAAASGTVLDLQFGSIISTVASVNLLTVPALSINATSFSSSAQVTGAGAGASFGTANAHTVSGFSVNVFGINILPFLDGNLSTNLAAGSSVDSTLNLSLLSGLTLPTGLKSLVTTGTIRIFNTGTGTGNTVAGQANASALQIQFNNVAIQGDVFSGLNSITTQTRVGGSVDVGQVAAAQAIPEPNALWLLLGAAAVFVLYRHRRQRAAR